MWRFFSQPLSKRTTIKVYIVHALRAQIQTEWHNDESKREVEEKKKNRMVKRHDFNNIKGSFAANENG